jgi:hypothetical protein
MALSFQPVTLDGTAPDRDATLVFRDGRLLAVLTCLDEIHDDLEGKWFVEVTFGRVPVMHPPVFETIDQFGAWVVNAD